jgi:hypothetical protein
MLVHDIYTSGFFPREVILNPGMFFLRISNSQMSRAMLPLVLLGIIFAASPESGYVQSVDTM